MTRAEVEKVKAEAEQIIALVDDLVKKEDDNARHAILRLLGWTEGDDPYAFSGLIAVTLEVYTLLMKRELPPLPSPFRNRIGVALARGTHATGLFCSRYCKGYLAIL
jgi:hypothetical protein